MRRPTIKDIAREAGVSPGAVSFALNDRPGVSEQTRVRVKEVAARLGWTRSTAALALSGQRAGAIGLVLQRGHGDDAGEAFVMRFVNGIHRVLRPLGQSLLFHLVEDLEQELATYRGWWGGHSVDGVVLMRPVHDDGRARLLAELGLPGVVVGDLAGPQLSSVCADEVATTRLLVDHFVERGHQELAFVSGPVSRPYIRWRSEAFQARVAERGVTGRTVHLESEDEVNGLRASQLLVRGHGAPTAILYDNELLAMGGAAACHDAGLKVGQDVCMVSFEDSATCRMQRPAISALRRQSEVLGEMAATALLGLVDGGEPTSQVAPLPELAVRASSGTHRPLVGSQLRIPVGPLG